MNRLLASVIQHPRTVLMVLVLLLLAGGTTYKTIAKEASPNITLPIIEISITYEGISPENAESLLVKPLENELRGLDRLKELKAVAKEGSAHLVLEFFSNVDNRTLVSRVTEKVDRAKALFPKGADEPFIKQMTAANSTPVLTVILSGDTNYRLIVEQARELKRGIEALPSIIEVKLIGEREDVVDIEISPEKIQGYGLNISTLSQLLQRSGAIVTAGALTTENGAFSVKVPSIFKEPKDLLNHPIVTSGDNSSLLVSDIADVRFGFMPADIDTRFDNKTSVELQVYKQSGENIFDSVSAIKDLAAQFQGGWPNSTNVDYVNDTSVEVSDMIADLEGSILLSVLLVVILLVATLGIGSAVLVAISIPTSFIAGILILNGFGYSVNSVVLFSLIMAVGLLVDGAIVVIEYTQRKISEGLSGKEAYIVASQNMAWPIIASTATTLCAFVPLIFWPGYFGEFMKYLPITLIATLSASLFVALIFVPTIGRVFSGRKRTLAIKPEGKEAEEVGAFNGIAGRYIALLSGLIKRPLRVTLAVLSIVVAIIYSYGESGLGVDFFPEVDSRFITVVVRDDGVSYSLSEKRDKIAAMYREIADSNVVDNVRIHAGGEGEIGRLYITLTEWYDRPHSKSITTQIRKRLLPLSSTLDVLNVGGPQQGKPFQLEFSADSIVSLKESTLWAKALIQKDPRFVNVEDTGPAGGVDWSIDFDRNQIARFGVSVDDIGTMVKLVTNGVYVGTYHPPHLDEEVDIRLRFPEKDRHLTQLDRLTVNSDRGPIQLSSLIQRNPIPKVNSINRVDGHRSMSIFADLAGKTQLNTVIEELTPMLDGHAKEAGVSYRFLGEAVEQSESGDFLMGAFVVALFMMGVILVTQFNSYFQVGLILSAVLLAGSGVLIGLMVKQQPFSIVMSGIGMISLAGIVVNNNIVLIDTFNKFVAQGLLVEEAILRTVYQRIRPVMLTTITTILGLMPMVLGLNISFFDQSITVGAPSSAYWNILATAIVSGLAFATVITLLLTPCLLVLGDRVMGRKSATVSREVGSAIFADAIS